MFKGKKEFSLFDEDIEIVETPVTIKLPLNDWKIRGKSLIMPKISIDSIDEIPESPEIDTSITTHIIDDTNALF